MLLVFLTIAIVAFLMGIWMGNTDEVDRNTDAIEISIKLTQEAMANSMVSSLPSATLETSAAFISTPIKQIDIPTVENTSTRTPIATLTKTRTLLTNSPGVTILPKITATSIPLSTRAPTHTITPEVPWEACKGLYLSRLRVGDHAYVSYNPPMTNRVRKMPYIDSEILGFVKPGEEVTIIEGPSCSGGYVWWKVTAKKDGLTGWISEGDADKYWLIPMRD